MQGGALQPITQIELGDLVDETVPPGPTTYGSHKAINELLLADASRKGCVDGRGLRLPIVLTRPRRGERVDCPA